MHGITDKDVAGAPSPAEAAKQAFEFIGEATLVGHSIGFDIGFLEAALGDGTRVRPAPTSTPSRSPATAIPTCPATPWASSRASSGSS